MSACVLGLGGCDAGSVAARDGSAPSARAPGAVADDADSHDPAGRSRDQADAGVSGRQLPALGPRYEVDDDEALAGAKQVASDVVRTLLTYDPDDTREEVVGRVTGPAAFDDVVTAAAPLFHRDAWSRGAIVYPQLGGATADRASVMVVARQTIGFADGSVVEHVRTLDVRAVRTDAGWVFDRLASAGGVPAARPDSLPPAAEAVLDDDRIELPDTAAWDIHRGRIAPELLAFMSRLADRTPYAVSALDTGHPWEVFGTDRQSKHTMGYAVDIYQLDDRRVIDDREDGSPTHAFVEWVYDRPELSEVGSPWALDGYGGRSFTDIVHQDHVHIGIPVDDE